ncbi:hypothetical protein PIB30_061891 [Stylosanthes scabra]|uniref:Uncharacterized protein n=1 Tax=Stylosanthes scabra TaxID=79078 RepID=A0ABU6UJS5_9FABA|nr:hypothetical protein [Stylosanthes scabra]
MDHRLSNTILLLRWGEGLEWTKVLSRLSNTILLLRWGGCGRRRQILVVSTYWKERFCERRQSDTLKLGSLNRKTSDKGRKEGVATTGREGGVTSMHLGEAAATVCHGWKNDDDTVLLSSSSPLFTRRLLLLSYCASPRLLS